MIYLIETDYPKISKKKDFKETVVKLDESNTIITAAKTFYNENNDELSKLIKKFPANIVGKFMKVKINQNYEVKMLKKDE